ncbi:hypothetical protein OG264_16125 [Streptomyces xanthophaeus]|uniref:hypothetical protein n=1 Tax=Streptomyces xanthophaeus TaxID=67385 RepID=UPI00386C9DA9|nr:hypothetical protein OG264_16125 [Streptomyces xanthophaeus]WST62138.1 hypothetical protein OG605_22310 [Streptomyces xanthophaeus]
MPHGLRTDMQIDGVWTPIPDSVYARAPVAIERGARDEFGEVSAGKATLQLDNRDLRYSPRNPRSANYGKIGRNTPLRLSVPAAESYLALPGAAGACASTPDHSSLDITGDLDVRLEASIDWTSGINQMLMGRWSQVDGDRSWYFRLLNGLAVLAWSTTGLNSGGQLTTIELPQLPRRAALRMTLDVNNGAGGWTAACYWADSLAGSWTLIGTTTGAGTTSIYSGNAQLEIGPTQGTRLPFHGRLHRAEVRNGISGTVVAAPDVRALAAGTASWSDSAGRTWSVAGGAEITDREYRLHGEISSWPLRVDVSGKDIHVPIEAAGILRRLGQGKKQLASTLRRRVPTVGLPVAYWPMEEGKTATQAYSPVEGVAPMTTTGFTYAADDDLAGSSALPTINSAARMRGTVPAHTATGVWMVACMYRSPADVATETVYLEWTTTGTARRIVLTVDPGGLNVRGYSSTGSLVFDVPSVSTEFHGQWNRLNISAEQSGPNVTYDIAWGVVNGTAYGQNTTVAATAGTVTGIDTTFGALAEGLAIGHVGVFSETISEDVYGFGDNGWNGELADVRFSRLALEEGVPASIASSTGPATPMGPQRPNKLVSLLRECAAADGGTLIEERDRMALRLRPRQSYYNQPVQLTLDYNTRGEVSPPLQPVGDDQHVRNDRTVNRIGGSSARAVDETGRLGTQDPPAGVGTYDDSSDLNLYDDQQPGQMAAWLLHLGTWDEDRYAGIRINLAAAPHLIPDVLALDIGDRIQIINPPPWLPPGPIDLIVRGYTERFGHPSAWDIVLTCTPAGPWTVGIVESATQGKADTDGSVLGTAATDSATTLVVHTEQTTASWNPIWVQDPSEFPFGLQVGGEVVTASAAAALAADTWTRTVAAGGWGTASDGHSWTQTGGSVSDLSVAATYGIVTLASAPSTIRLLTMSETCRDCEIRASLAVSATATGASLVAALLARYVDSSNYYRVRTEFTTAGGITLTLTRGSTPVGSSVITGVTYTPGSVIEIRMRIIGHRVLARVWPAGTNEPGTWHLDQLVTSSPIDEGLVGVAASGITGNTNTSPQIRFHDWQIPSPQRITVSRSTNGIAKGHAAGSRISLAQPAVVAL